MKLFIFGLGYSSLYIAQASIKSGFSVSGTCRTREKCEQMKAQGIEAFPFDIIPESALKSATHILSSIPPQDTGDVALPLIPLSPSGRGQGEGVYRNYQPKPEEWMINQAKALRFNQTDTEKKLWSVLRNRQLANHKFRRQEPVGSYIADFLCAEAKLIIELDGGQHSQQQAHDHRRDVYLHEQGYRVLRFWNNEVFENLDGVIETILQSLSIPSGLPPHPNPLPAGEREYRPWLGYLSTTGVYGDWNGEWVDENSELRPNNERLKRRVAAENAWREKGGHIFRLAGIYGPGRSAIDDVREGTARRIDKPGQVFSRIHVEDIAQAVVASMLKPSPGRIYNICDDEPAPSHEVVKFACELLGTVLPPLVPFAEAVLSPMGREFYSANRWVSNTRIKQELGITLKYPTYREGLKALVKVA